MQPCDVQARGVTGTQLDILDEQKVEFTLRHKDYYMTFEHTFVVSPLIRCSSGILGMDFLQRVGAEITLTAQVLTIRSPLLSVEGPRTGGLRGSAPDQRRSWGIVQSRPGG